MGSLIHPLPVVRTRSHQWLSTASRFLYHCPQLVYSPHRPPLAEGKSRSKEFGTPHETLFASIHPPFSKVSPISTKPENEGVNSNKSHEVPGKCSTDGTSTTDADKIGGISLDALSKANATLLKRKELAEKMKRIPMLNKGAESARESSKAPISSPAYPNLLELKNNKHLLGEFWNLKGSKMISSPSNLQVLYAPRDYRSEGNTCSELNEVTVRSSIEVLFQLEDIAKV
ncbi:hypothetical protein L2E82_14620 [Cichorium intybus]|uniref:Uncharacterized protein n=1 Tax=Cichorium intybus TaxID=13427 RepID=A0ACB9F061_CICIN|nr:hypothetical protein L2E82_14620 [Cichorium intybus]